ncbi:MAG: hypothetical protein V8R91_07265 [Butyricimonas faecihominis]
MRKVLLSMILVGWSILLYAQYEGMEYYREQDPAVQANLEQWQDLKFGFFVHSGTIARKGIASRGRFVRKHGLDSTGHDDFL